MIKDNAVLGSFPIWIVSGYKKAQDAMANTLSGQDVVDAISRQDDVMWGYWTPQYNTKKHKGLNNFNEPAFYSILSGFMSSSNPAQQNGLNTLKQSILDAKAAYVKSSVLGIDVPVNTNNVVEGSTTISAQMSGGGTPMTNTGIAGNINQPMQAPVNTNSSNTRGSSKLAATAPHSNVYLYVGIGVFTVAAIGAGLIWKHFHKQKK